MRKGRINKIVGKISNDVIDKYKLYEYKDEVIVQSLDLYLHVAKHVHEFESVDSYNHTMSNIPEIISEPDFVYHDSNRKFLLYFKELSENVCVVVKLNLSKNKDTYVSTVYPVSKKKIEKYIQMSYIVNR